MSDEDLYQKSGVDVAKGDRLVAWLKNDPQQNPVGSSQLPAKGASVGNIGSFAGLFRLGSAWKAAEDPVLVASTDGVGTKLLLGLEHQQIEGLGQDLVAMCVNDLYTIGAEPLFFLDYYATSALDEAQFKAILIGIKAGLAQTGSCLLGGETAELPGLYQKGHFDLAGFVVGMVDHSRRLDAHYVKEGDCLVAFPSSGFHANGYSLIRRWLGERPRPDLISELLAPTRIYHQLPQLAQQFSREDLHACAHITGGGISGNLQRILPSHLAAQIDPSTLPMAPWMASYLADQGVTPLEVEGVFNMGCGMILAVSEVSVDGFLRASHELNPVVIGRINHRHQNAPVTYL